MARATLTFESKTTASPEQVWSWATSVAGILAELRPVARMTFPAGRANILDFDVELGQPLARSWILLFGFLPIERSDLTLVELDTGRRFVEQSPMLTMRLWRHERTVAPIPGGSSITDRLTFEPRLGGPIVEWFVAALFRHRHRVLRRRLGAQAC